jgi:hypothetical protein
MWIHILNYSLFKAKERKNKTLFFQNPWPIHEPAYKRNGDL